MGMSPEQVLAMPLHDYQAALHHFNLAHSSPEDEQSSLSEDDFDEMMIGLAGSGSKGVH